MKDTRNIYKITYNNGQVLFIKAFQVERLESGNYSINDYLDRNRSTHNYVLKAGNIEKIEEITTLYTAFYNYGWHVLAFDPHDIIIRSSESFEYKGTLYNGANGSVFDDEASAWYWVHNLNNYSALKNHVVKIMEG